MFDVGHIQQLNFVVSTLDFDISFQGLNDCSRAQPFMGQFFVFTQEIVFGKQD